MLAISPYWYKLMGLQAILAPTSQMVTGPVVVGKTTAIPGRFTPGSVRIRIWNAATHAPVLPAEITASVLSSLASLASTAMELRGFLRRLSMGFSSIAMTSGASAILLRPLAYLVP